VKFLRLLLFCGFIFSLSTFPSEAKNPPVDILIFAPHPDDETLACGQTIARSIKEKKKVLVVFLTNGDASPESAAGFVKKAPAEMTAQDYLRLGRERQAGALRAGARLGLKNKDIIFLSYPDQGLASLWEGAGNDQYRSGTTGLDCSAYPLTWGRARMAYSRDDLLRDVKQIITENRPSRIYAPSPLDDHGDHQAAANFINRALNDLMLERVFVWPDLPRLSYYTVHARPGLPGADAFSSRVDDPVLRLRKAEAWKQYQTESGLPSVAKLWDHFKDSPELFQDVPAQKKEYLEKVYGEWEHIARVMKENGYNLNFGPAVDTAEDINDPGIDLVKKGRIFSDNPESVLEITGKICGALESEGMIPVLKHFPGLGAARQDTHKWLPRVNKSKEALYKKDIFPFQELIKKNSSRWIMTSHAIYPGLDSDPASLSYKIQTGLLRKELGFKGIIIADELLNMQAIEEYAFREKIPDPYIGEIAVRAFMAGTDIALIYPPEGRDEEVILEVLSSVKKAIADNRITEEQIDDSVSRILKEKERLFDRSLLPLLKTLSLEKKIAQKIMINVPDKYELVEEYGLGGVEARERGAIEKMQKASAIPLFIACQHEGGRVQESGNLNVYTSSAYLTGAEFKRTFKPAPGKNTAEAEGAHKYPAEEFTEKAFFEFGQANINLQSKIVELLSSSVDEYIGFCSRIKQGGHYLKDPGYSGPLNINLGRQEKVSLKAFEDLPAKWLRIFPDKSTALCAYSVLKGSFEKLEKTGPGISFFSRSVFSRPDRMTGRLNRLKELIRENKGKQSKAKLRVLCLAAHPDDEDCEALAFFKEKFNADTFILLATRGQAGENETGPELYEELGALRSEEIEMSAAVLGVSRVYYLGKEDFGYCLDPEEALRKWGRQDTLSRLVYFYRLIRPDIIITRHNNVEKDHCQHRALAILAQEAFDLSADPQAYPQADLPSWQPARFYQRQSGKNDEYPLADILIETQEKTSRDGKTYAQISAEALSRHRSQGFSGSSSSPALISYELVKAKGSPAREILSGREAGSIPSGIPGIRIAGSSKIGLIEERDNTLFVALKTLGCDFEKIDRETVLGADLSRFDTILIGKGLSGIQENAANRLMEFVEKGGNLVVLFQDQITAGAFPAPYDLRIVFDPVPDENSPLEILLPGHPLFNLPNKITPGDFTGWKQDRMIYSPAEYSGKYTELTSVPGGGSSVNKSAYLTAVYGKGSYILSTYSWSRQLREFNPGAYKNLANMLAYPYVKSEAEGK